MNFDNALPVFDNGPCGHRENPLFAGSRRVGGEVTQRIANPCPARRGFLSKFSNMILARGFDKTAGQSRIIAGTLTTLLIAAPALAEDRTTVTATMVFVSKSCG